MRGGVRGGEKRKELSSHISAGALIRNNVN